MAFFLSLPAAERRSADEDLPGLRVGIDGDLAVELSLRGVEAGTRLGSERVAAGAALAARLGIDHDRRHLALGDELQPLDRVVAPLLEDVVAGVLGVEAAEGDNAERG